GVVAVKECGGGEQAGKGQILTELWEDLAALGDEVTVIASRGSYLGGGRLSATEVIQGVRVVRPWATSLGKATIAHRLTDYLSFWATAVACAAAEARPDVILVLSSPPMIAAGGVLVAKVRGVPIGTWVPGVYPDAAVAVGRVA